MEEKKVPVRTCIACRKKSPKKELIRIVKKPDGEIVIDEKMREQARGVYICKNSQCVEKLKKHKSLNRAFACEVKEDVYTAVEEAIIESAK